MSTTQRSESINSFFDGFVTSGTTLNEFVEKYNQAVDARYDSFKKQDFESRHKERHLTLNMPLEEHAAKVYTRAIFTKFSDVLSHSFPLSMEKLGNDGEWVTYRVFNRKEKDYSATVKMKLENRETRCSCQYFEFVGIPCEHIIAIFSVENVEQIPEHMILRCWSKEGNDIISTNKDICNFDGEGLLCGFEIRHRVSKLIKLADRSNEAAKFACDGLDSLTESLGKFPTPDDSIIGLEDFDSHYLSSQTEESSMMRLNDLNISQTKGRKRESHNISQGHRIHSGIEEASKNTNICGNCKKRGHNKRTCREKKLY
ncbi:protein FAR1-RELATED SEQUENCE 9-like [Gastrolobium bilobum]|uniref:protein FAR1-RELATED SEQUENCE 9-like n=1 Tax=Gastrolobium bilobum TaxID=150636 RepID=UPI002AB0AD73|nr:protein FAR1-RELATED SEQUENCE 9-like [Gastrolobium bilobum]